MTGIDDRINRRTALVQLTAATMLAAGAAARSSLAQIKTTDLGSKTYMPRRRWRQRPRRDRRRRHHHGGCRARAAPRQDQSRHHGEFESARQIPRRYPFPRRADRRNAPFHRDGAIIWRRRICGYGSLRAPPTGSATAKPTRAPGRDPDRDLCRRDHDGERPRPRGAAHPCHQCPYRRGQLDLYRGRQWYLYGGLFYNNSRYPMIDYANGGDIRGMIRANEAFGPPTSRSLRAAAAWWPAGRRPVVPKARTGRRQGDCCY